MPLHTKQFKNNNKNQPNKQGEKKKTKKKQHKMITVLLNRKQWRNESKNSMTIIDIGQEIFQRKEMKNTKRRSTTSSEQPFEYPESDVLAVLRLKFLCTPSHVIGRAAWEAEKSLTM